MQMLPRARSSGFPWGAILLRGAQALERLIKFVKLLWQIGIVLGICFIGEGLARFIPIPFPASVISMILLFILLLTKGLKPGHIQQKANFLTKNMAFFFIPAGVGVMTIYPQVKNSILLLLLVCVLTSIITFGVTALTVRWVIRLQERMRMRPKTNSELQMQENRLWD